MGYKNDNQGDVNSISYRDCRHCDVYNVDDVEKIGYDDDYDDVNSISY